MCMCVCTYLLSYQISITSVKCLSSLTYVNFFIVSVEYYIDFLKFLFLFLFAVAVALFSF